MKPRWVGTLLLCLLALVSFVIVVFDSATSWIRRLPGIGPGAALWDMIAFRAVALVLLVVTLELLRARASQRWRVRQGFDDGPGRPRPEYHEGATRYYSAIIDAMITVARRYDADVTSLFGRILIADRDYHVRITEEAEAVGEMLRSVVTTTFGCRADDLARLREKDTGVLLVPILHASIGTMLDNVEPVDGTGASVPLLSQHDTRGLIAIVLQGLFDDAFGTDHPAHDSTLWSLRRLVCRVGRIPPT